MKNTIVLVACLVAGASLSFNAQAGCVGPVVNGQCMGASVDSPSVGQSSAQRYQGTSGRNYEYDLSKPSDQLRYSVDIDAQRRDQRGSINREIDRSLGQYGGGMLDE